MRRRVFVTLVLLATCSLVIAPVVWVNRAAFRPAKGFEAGQCTWYVWHRAMESGWEIKFDQPYGRHAKNWPQRVTNAELVAKPERGTIVVLDAWKGNPYGHVAYVESVAANGQLTLTHANMAIGDQVRTVDEKPVRQVRGSYTNGQLTLDGQTSSYKVLGFLRRL